MVLEKNHSDENRSPENFYSLEIIGLWLSSRTQWAAGLRLRRKTLFLNVTSDLVITQLALINTYNVIFHGPIVDLHVPH